MQANHTWGLCRGNHLADHGGFGTRGLALYIAMPAGRRGHRLTFHCVLWRRRLVAHHGGVAFPFSVGGTRSAASLPSSVPRALPGNAPARDGIRGEIFFRRESPALLPAL